MTSVARFFLVKSGFTQRQSVIFSYEFVTEMAPLPATLVVRAQWHSAHPQGGPTRKQP